MPRGGWTGGKRAVDLTQEEIIREYIQKDVSLQEAAKVLQCSRKILTAALHLHKIPIKSHTRGIVQGRPLIHQQLANHDWLKAQITMKTFPVIARELGMSASSIRGYAIRHGLYEKYSTRKESGQAGSRRATYSRQKFDTLRKDDIIRIYKETDLTMTEACHELECSLPTLIKAMRYHGIEPKSTGSSAKRWTPNREDFPELRDQGWLQTQLETKTILRIAQDLGTSAWNVDYHVRTYQLQVIHEIPFMATLNVETLHRRKDRGYIRVCIPSHPFSDADGFVFEHRVVLENTLGRYLGPDEVSHHKREDEKWNNDPDNLELMTRLEHARHHFLKRREEVESLKREVAAAHAQLSAQTTRLRKKGAQLGKELSALNKQLEMFHEPED